MPLLVTNARPPLIQGSINVNTIGAGTIVTNVITTSNNNNITDFSVNDASVENVSSSFPTLKTSARTNAAGAFNGGGTGNKCIMGLNNFDNLLLENVTSIDISFENLQGGVNDSYTGGAGGAGGFDNQAPQINLIVDINGDGSSILVFTFGTDSLSSPLIEQCGTHSSLGNDKYKLFWDCNMAVFVVGVGAADGASLGGISPVDTIGANWYETIWTFKDIINANPLAKVINTDSGDGGLPILAKTSGLLLTSGDSSSQEFSRKNIYSLLVSGLSVIA